MRHFNVTGMSCVACSSRVEKAVLKVEGVSYCSVNLLTNSMSVDGDADTAEIIKAVKSAGYGASLKEKKVRIEDKEKSYISNSMINESMDDDIEGIAYREEREIRNRIISSFVFMILLMYLSMGAMMWGWPLPSFFEHNYIAIGLVQMILSTAIIYINKKFYVNGFKSLWNKAPNMDSLVALGSCAGYVYSVVVLFLLSKAYVEHDMELIHKYMHEFYFEASAMILVLISVGKMLEARSKGKTTNAIKSLMNLTPKIATVIRENKEIQLDILDVEVGDIYVVRPGENIPVDGIITEGHTSIDESALTGESIPVDVNIGDEVSAATTNMEGFIKCRAIRVGEDTVISQIIKSVNEAVISKAPIAKVADVVSGVFVPIVIGIAMVTFLIWIISGQSVGFALARAISVLVISCPCALGLATPVAIMVGSGMGAKHGIMFKNGEALEQTGKVDVVVCDKTGTITKGMPVVTDVFVCDKDMNQEKLMKLAYSLERRSEHPLSKAIMRYVEENDMVSIEEITDFKAVPGNGLEGIYNGVKIRGGNYTYIAKECSIELDIKEKADSYASKGKTPLYFEMNGILQGIIVVSDVIKADSKLAIKEMQDMGIKVVMLTGDNEHTAKEVGKEAGISNIIAEVSPEEKAGVISVLQQIELKEFSEDYLKTIKANINKLKNTSTLNDISNKRKNKVIMVGDGINDAPALVNADVGIAIGAGTDIAIESADVVLMKSNLSDVVAAIRLSKKTLKNIYENLFWAFIYNIIGIPLAAGVWIPLFGLELNPMFGAMAMSLSSFCVVSNSLRLNMCKMYSKEYRNNKEIKSKTYKNSKDIMLKEYMNKKDIKEIKEMKKLMKIEGMMCGHCEARVKKVLEGIEGVTEAVVSHEKDEAIVVMESEVSDEILKNAVEEQDYKVLDISIEK